MSDQEAQNHYVVRLRSPVPEDDIDAITQRVALVTKMPESKARKMVGRPPGNLTRETTEAQAKRLADNLRSAGMDAVVVDNAAPEEALDTVPPTSAPIKSEPAKEAPPPRARQTPNVSEDGFEGFEEGFEEEAPPSEWGGQGTRSRPNDNSFEAAAMSREMSKRDTLSDASDNILWSDDRPAAAADAGAGAARAPRRRSPLVWIVGLLVVIVLGVGAAAYFVPGFSLPLERFGFGTDTRETVPAVPNTRPSPGTDDGVSSDVGVAPLPEISDDGVAVPTNIFSAARDGTPEQLQALVQQGADVDQADAFGQTPLMYAVNNDNPAVLEVLIGAGAGVDARTNAGWTPLMYAARDGTPEMVQILLDAGANPNATNASGETALDIAEQTPGREQIVALLQ